MTQWYSTAPSSPSLVGVALPSRSRRPLGLPLLGLCACVGLALSGAPWARASDQSSPRSLGMGGSLRAAATGASGIFLNPAGITLARTYAVEAFYDFHVQKNGHYAHSSVVDSVASKWVAAGLYYNLLVMRPDLVERSTGKKQSLDVAGHETGISLAVPLGNRFSLGTTVKYQFFKAKMNVSDGEETAEETVDRINNVGLDVGAVVVLYEGLTLGVTGMNLVPQRSPFAPMSMGMGVAYSYKTYLTAAFDVLLDFTSKDDLVVNYHGGIEGFFAGQYAVRAGAMHQGFAGGTYVTAGFGYMSPRAGVDVFLVQQVDGGIETRIGFAAKLFVK